MSATPRRIIVTGGRDFSDRGFVRRVLAELRVDNLEQTVVHGGARGADTLAGIEAIDLGYWVETFPANWGKWGHAAGSRRNEEMAELGADLCLAFPGGNGTRDMVKRAGRHGIPVRWAT